MKKTVHIIAFDIPFPANYGGAIDVFHKIRCLHKQGVKIILHCFQYGSRVPTKELEQYCEKVFYYPRKMSIVNHFSKLPFNVNSRINKELEQRLLQDNFPIIFEVLHTCYLLNHPQLKNRIKLYRHSNIEHEYFNELAKAETQFLKKIYLRIEAFKLKHFEKQISKAQAILSVSETELKYFKTNYPSTVSYYLPSFHAFDKLTINEGKGNYILYHGNLGISENYQAVYWLIDNVFSQISIPVVIAGLNPPKQLVDRVGEYKHITLKANCNELEMQQLIDEAHIHCLYTQQGTGLKLKLVNVLFAGKFVLANEAMLNGTGLESAVKICNSANEYIKQINNLFNQSFTQQDIEERTKLITPMFNEHKTEFLLALIQ